MHLPQGRWKDLCSCPFSENSKALSHLSPPAHQGEALGRGSPAFDVGEVPFLDHFFGLLIHSHHTLLSDAQEPGHQLVLSLHLFLLDRGYYWCYRSEVK